MYSRYYTLKPKAVRLRKTGKTYGEIKQILRESIPKSTLSCWFRGISLSKLQQERIKKRASVNIQKAQVKAWAINHKRRAEYLESLFVCNRYLLPLMRRIDVAKIALAMLYLGEGAKWRGHPGLQLGSSDPNIISIYIGLLRQCYDIPTAKLRARVIYRADQDILKLTAFWSSITGIPRNHFYRTKPDPRTIGRKTMKKDYRGVCQISCAGTEIQLQLDIVARMFLQVFKGP